MHLRIVSTISPLQIPHCLDFLNFFVLLYNLQVILAVNMKTHSNLKKFKKCKIKYYVQMFSYYAKEFLVFKYIIIFN